jgi:DNA modification methylase
MASATAIHRADWLDLPSFVEPGSVDLVYVDPPFGTGAAKRTPPGAAKAGRAIDAAYDDSLADVSAWLAWIEPRLRATRPLLKPTGSILLHVDWRTSHRARVLLDGFFGADSFVNHLVWSYGLGGSSPRRFARKHDDILFYCVDPERYFFDPPRVEATSRRLAGQTKKATDVIEIASLNNMARERTGYPTQKPLALLELLIAACCPPGGLVVDPCSGSGTTLVAAMNTGRRALGCDVSEEAVRVSAARTAQRAE